MTIKELYEFAKVNGLENLPFRYGYIDDDGGYRPHDFDFADFEHDAEEVTMLFSKSALKALAEEMAEEVTMQYVYGADNINLFRCSYCGKEMQPAAFDYCPGCGRKFKRWE